LPLGAERRVVESLVRPVHEVHRDRHRTRDAHHARQEHAGEPPHRPAAPPCTQSAVSRPSLPTWPTLYATWLLRIISPPPGAGSVHRAHAALHPRAGRAMSAAGVSWDLATLYAGPDDPSLETDLREAQRAADDFGVRYRGRVATLAPDELAVAIAEYEAIEERGRRPSFYASLLFAADTHDETAKRLSERAREAWVDVVNGLTFFELELKDLPDERHAVLV